MCFFMKISTIDVVYLQLEIPVSLKIQTQSFHNTDTLIIVMKRIN